MKHTKHALLYSVLSLVLCVAMLIGSTFAWFTDSVSTGSNIIQAGNLDIGLLWTDDLTGEWTDVEDKDSEKIFGDSLWEPGYTQVRYFKIQNKGDLAFKFSLNVVPNSQVTPLAEVIDVFYLESPTDTIENRATLQNLTPVGTLADVITGTVAAQGVLLPEGKIADGIPAGEMIMAVALKMQESAGNEYQGMSLCDGGFTVELVATQYTFEEDAFGSDYDTDASFAFPDNQFNETVSLSFKAENGVLTEDVVFDGNMVAATVPAGVKVGEGITELKLTVTEKSGSDNNLELDKNDQLRALDVHIEGIAADNTVPMTITLKEVAPIGLNMGNYTLYHKGNLMTYKASAEDFTAADQFKYDPATGNITLYMANFSEVALVADTENAWKGEFDYSWYTNAVAPLDGESTTEYVIANADQLAAFGAIVGEMNGQTQDSFSGKTVKLLADINLGDKDNANESLTFHPIGYYYTDDKNVDKSTGNYYSTVYSFEGTFDGNGHTVSNFYQNTWEIKGDYDGNYYSDAMGLFGYIVNGKVCNLTVDNFSSDGEFTPTGVIAAYACNSTFENIAITNCNPRVYNTGNGGIVGIGGNSDDPDTYKLTFTNITIDNSNIISALWGSWDVACGGLVGMFRGDGHVYMTNCHVAAQIDVYNDVCGNYQYYWYRYSGMMVGTNKNMTTDANGYTVPETDKFHAENCTVHFGDWNDFYYCELVANSLASYTHDHQFSRLTEISSLDEIKSGDTWTKTGNFLLISGDTKTCYHIVKNSDGTLKQHLHTDAGYEDSIDEDGDGNADLKEDKQIVYLPFNQLFTGYGWGVKHIPIYDDGTPNTFAGVTILDREVADSVEKFETKFTGDFLYRVGNLNEVSIGSLFAAAPKLDADGNKLIDDNGETIYWDINDAGVYVTIESVDASMNVGGTFTPNTTEWEKGTIKFTETGVVKVTVQDYIFCKPTVLYLEVVDATNITSATGTITGGNFVLLSDVNATSYVNYWNSNVYGNGFTYSLNGAPTAYNSKQGHGLLITNNATLDNLVIVGDIYNSYGAYTNQDYYNTAIDVIGDTTIQNCYIANCAAPVKARSNVTIKDTTLYGGSVANLIIMSGTTTLENVTTANYDDGRTIVGFGIAVHKDAADSAKLVLNGALTQYNFISEANTPTDTNAKALHEAMFESSCSDYHFGTSPNRYVNTGVVSLSDKFNEDDISDNVSTGYKGSVVTFNNNNGYVYTQPKTIGSVNNNYDQAKDNHYRTKQGPVPPNYNFNYTTINYKEKVDGSNDYCYEDSGTVYLSMDEGDTFNWDTSILTATKNGRELKYTVSIDNVDYTGKSIAFNKAGVYEVVYTYVDSNNYAMDDEGTITNYTETYNKTVYINVSVVKANWKSAEIKINNTAMSGIYVMSGDYDYSYKMKFLDCISITDYDEAGNASTVDLSSNIKSTSFIDINGTNPGKFDANNGTITITYNNGKILTVSIGAWSGSGPSTKTCSVKTDDGVYLITDGASNAANTGVTWKVTGYSYTGNNGALIDNNTTITFTWDTNSEGYNSKSSGGCFTPDTLITLADGSQKRVDELTFADKILVWDFFTGSYAEKDISLLVNHGEGLYKVTNLRFSDGTMLKIIAEHGVFDYDLNRYVYLTVDNMDDYIGHRFVQYDPDGGYNIVTLTGAFETEEYTSAWSITSADTSNAFASGMLTVAPPEDFYNWIEMGGKLIYDVEQFRKDVETYGLYTYDDFKDYVTYEQFVAWSGAYLKVAVEKGYFTFDYILELIELYKGWMPN